MSAVVIGLNHRTAPLELLERMQVGHAQLPKALHDLVGRENVSEAVVLSTCNRLEIYVRAERFHGAYADVRNVLAEISFLPPEDFADHLYTHFGDEAVAHLFRVIAGLDSAVLGENEIQGQVRRAWEAARQEGASGKALNLLFRHAVEAGKRARTETRINRSITSMSQAAVVMAGSHLGSLDGASVLVIGAGEMGEGMVTALTSAGAGDVRVANRTSKRAHELASRMGGTAVPLLDLPAQLLEVDVVLTSTGADALMIEEEDLAEVMAARAGRPLLVVDIAVPRDVSPAAGALEGVTLLDMNDLRTFAAAGVADRRREVARAQDILVDELHRYQEAGSARRVAPTVVALRERAEELRLAELTKFQHKHSYLGEDELKAVEGMSRAIVAKLLHAPTVVLKDAAGSARGDRLLAALQELFGIESGGSPIEGDGSESGPVGSGQ